MMAASLANAIVFHWAYVTFVVPEWEFFRFTYATPSLERILLAYIGVVVPSLLLPSDIDRPSHLVLLAIYLVIYVPSQIVCALSANLANGDFVRISLALICALVLLVASASFRWPKPRIKASSASAFAIFLVTVTVGITAYLAMMFHTQMQLVSFSDVYAQRSAFDTANTNGANGYLITWLTCVMVPALIAFGLSRHRKMLVVIAAGCQLVGYAIGAAKAVALATPIYFAVYYLVQRRTRRLGLAAIWAATGLLGGSVLFWMFMPDAGRVLCTIVSVRLFGIPGLLTEAYYRFFASNPWTWFSQVKGFSWITRYPYELPVANQIGYSIFGSSEADMNAHFWANDGIACAGLPGLIGISVILGFILSLFDSVAVKDHPEIGCTLAVSAAVGLTNGSVFTNILTGGLIVVYFFLLRWPVSKNGLNGVTPPYAFSINSKAGYSSPADELPGDARE
jgi:hypothetical protein